MKPFQVSRPQWSGKRCEKGASLPRILSYSVLRGDHKGSKGLLDAEIGIAVHEPRSRQSYGKLKAY